MDNKEKVIKKVIEIIAEQKENNICVENISEDTKLIEDLKYDSVDIIDFIVLLEEYFQTDFDEVENLIDKIDTVGHISELIQNMI